MNTATVPETNAPDRDLRSTRPLPRSMRVPLVGGMVHHQGLGGRSGPAALRPVHLTPVRSLTQRRAEEEPPRSCLFREKHPGRIALRPSA